jgi:hypothetical protein
MDNAALIESTVTRIFEEVERRRSNDSVLMTAAIDASARVRHWREGRIFETGDLAFYNGGLWQAQNQTSARPLRRDGQPLGIAGPTGEWLLICDGIASAGPYRVADDPRTLGIRIIMASGLKRDFDVTLPFPLHRGVWEPGAYFEGDEVAHDGASYRAQRNTRQMPDSADWAVVSARGRQGETGERGPRGETGGEGPRGETGPPGEKGEPGPPGERGRTGRGIVGIKAVEGYPGLVRIVLDDGTITDPVPVSAMQFLGVYQPGAGYQRGDVVRLGFHLWVATEPTEEVPGANARTWALFLTGQEPGGTGGGGGGGGGITEAEADLRYINTTGDTMTGALTLAGPPTADLHAATKLYVDGFLPLGGGTMTGQLIMGAPLNMNGQRILQLSLAPLAATEAANKAYVDGLTNALDARVTDHEARIAALEAGTPRGPALPPRARR